MPFIAANVQGHRWSVCAFGSQERACAAAAMALGGHVRVGFENSLWHGDGRLAKSNSEVIDQGKELASLMGRPLASPKETRVLLASSPW